MPTNLDKQDVVKINVNASLREFLGKSYLRLGVVICIRSKVTGKVRSISRSYSTNDPGFLDQIKQENGSYAGYILGAIGQNLTTNPQIRENIQSREIADANLPAINNARRYDFKPGISIPLDCESIVYFLAEKYFAATKKKLTITSGTRTPEQQSRAIFYKLQNGKDIVALYANKSAAGEIKKAYDNSKGQEDKSRIDILAQVITNQIAKGIYISKHLRNGAFDIRSRDMTENEKEIFRKIVKANSNLFLLEEGTPPHFHIHIK